VKGETSNVKRETGDGRRETSNVKNEKQETLVNNVEGVDAAIENFSSLRMKYSILLNTPVEEVTNDKMLEFIEEWYGTKYRFGGSDKNGIDCSAFVQAFMTTMYNFMMPRMAKDQYLQTYRIQKGNLREGDLVFFHTTRWGISHVGIYLRNNKFVHASTAGGVAISDMSEGYYAQHFVCGGRVRMDKLANGN
jgi:lipoprotein Spr